MSCNNNIYRYRKVSDFTLTELMNDNFVLSSADTFNDEHDMAIAFDLERTYKTFKDNESFLKALAKLTAKSRNQTFQERYEYLKSNKGTRIVKYFINYMFTEFSRNLKRKLLVGCFTEVFDNEVMWAHYSDNGRGFVVAYDKNDIEKFVKSNSGRDDLSSLESVVYDDNPYDITDNFIDFLNLFSKDKDTFIETDSEFAAFKYFLLEGNEGLNNALVRKRNEWKYENEKRIIVYNFKSKGNEHVSVTNIKPKEVILGENMTLPNKYLIASICNKKDIKIFVVEPSFEKKNFKLGIRPLLDLELRNLLNDFQDYLKLDGLVDIVN